METHDDDPTTPHAGTPAGDSDPTTTPHASGASEAGGADPSEAPTSAGDAPTGGAAQSPPDSGPRRLYKSRDDRMIGGVCGGLAEYFAIDAVIVRVIAVALVFAGGAGLLAYVAAWLLVPERDAGPSERPGRTATIVGAVALVLAVGAVTPFWGGPFGGWHGSGPFVSLVFLGLAGVGIWYLASGERPAVGSARDVLRRAGFGLALLAVCGFLALAGAWATAAGGGIVVAIAVIVAGLWLVAAAFLGGARWLILPALALALPAGVVSAANVNVDGGVGERSYRPLSADQVRDNYRLGVGRLVVDMRNAKLPAGDRHVRIDLGVGEAVIAVAPDVCVTTAAKVGAGQVAVFDRNSGGVDVDWQDEREAPAGTTRLIVDGDIGVGALDVGTDDPNRVRGHNVGDGNRHPGNEACIGGARG
jgi:phage shock protein PspC (stress-responsive transcriptional regulator)